MSLKKYSSLPINEQATAFLDRYLFDFQDTYEEVLDLAESFRKAAGDVLCISAELFSRLSGGDSIVNARTAMGSTETGGASLLELCLHKYGKSVTDFFTQGSGVDMSAEDASRLKKAIEDYQNIQAEIAAREKKMADLQTLIKAGGVKGFKAKAELEALKGADTTEQNRRQIKAAAAQRSAQRQASRSSLGPGSIPKDTLAAEAIKAKIAASIQARMEVLQKEEKERAAAMAQHFAGAFQDTHENEGGEEEGVDVDDMVDMDQLAEVGEEFVGAELGDEHHDQDQQRATKAEQERLLQEEAAERARVAAEKERERQEAERLRQEELARLAAEKERARLAAEEERARVAAEKERARAEAAAAAQKAAEEEQARQVEAAAKAAARDAEVAAAKAALEKARQDKQRADEIAALEAEAARAAEAAAAAAREEEAARAAEAARQEEAARAAEAAQKEEEARIAEEARQEAEARAAEAARIRTFAAWLEPDADLEDLEQQSVDHVFSPADWSVAFQQAVAQKLDHVVQSLRRVVSIGTKCAVESGKYELSTGSSDTVPMEFDRAALAQVTQQAIVHGGDKLWPKSTLQIKGTAHFLQGDCIDVALWLQSSRGVNPAVVVCADPSGNGGSFPRGSIAQEEEFFRRTSLECQAGGAIPLGGCRYLPVVYVLRQGEGAGYAFSTAPSKVATISAPALSAPTLVDGKLSDADNRLFKATIRSLFGAALQGGHDAIVITAFGCGFNRNSAAVVAPLFHDILVSEYPKSFKHVTFAISDPVSFQEFQSAYVKRAEVLKTAKAAKAAAKAKKEGAISQIERKGSLSKLLPKKK